jgi:AraC-like DNA-binding protein
MLEGTPPAGEFVRGRFDEFEKLAAAIKPWGLEFGQLDPGPTRAELRQAFEPGVVVQRARFNRRYDQRGESPPGTRTFGVLEHGVAGVRWCGRAMSDGEMSLFGSSGEFEAASEPDFACMTLSFSEERLAEVAEIHGTPGVFALLGREERMFRVDPSALRVLRRHVEQTLAGLEENAGPWPEEELAFEIPVAILNALATATLPPAEPRAHIRSRALARARAFIADHAHEPPSVSAVCRASGASWRTLDYAFREHFGVTPKTYLQALRLNAVRRELRAAEPSVGIADIANRWGFWHAGQFAADYWRLFGELPSETVRSP